MATFDPFAADTIGHIADEMTGPMTAGMRVDTLSLSEAGGLAMTAPLREAALFVALRRDLGRDPLRLEATLGDGADAVRLADVTFAGWSQAGSVLPLHCPHTDPETALTGAFAVTLKAVLAGVELSPDQAGEWIEGRLVSGRLGRLLALLEAEHVALRRQARAVAAARLIGEAEGESLDRHGSDLGIPRLVTGLAITEAGSVESVARRETDDDYRRRLGIFHAFSMPRSAQYAARLGADGPIAGMGFAGSVSLIENPLPFSVAVQLVAVAASAAEAQALRTNFLAFLRRWVLVDPALDVPADRRLTSIERSDEDELRKRLRQSVDLAAGVDASMAPELARCLDRAARLMAALGVADRILVRRALVEDGGSRLGLGLGIEVAPPKPETVKALADAAVQPAPDDPALRPTFLALRPPATVEADPDGAWFFRACGFRTVHRLADDTLYLSHLTTGALVIAGDALLEKPAANASAREVFSARFAAPSGAASSATLMAASAAASAQLPGLSLAGDAAARLQNAQAPDADTRTRLLAAGLPAVSDWDSIQDHVGTLDAAGWGVLELPAATGDALRTGDQAAWDTLEAVVRAVRQAGAAAAVPLFDAGGVALLVSVAALPLVGANLSGRASTGFRWFLIPIDRRLLTSGESRLAALSRRVGTNTELIVRRPGLYALVALGYERLDGTDPFEVRLEAGAGDLLSFEQYEALMNLMALRVPAGVEINTWSIRRFHVGEGGKAVPLDPSAARSFRPWRRPRRAGAPPTDLPS